MPTEFVSSKDRRDGFWTCTRSEVQQLAASAMVTNSTVSQPSYSAEERTRAKQAFGLCRLLGHPSDQALTRLLDCGNMLGTEITSQDLRTARALYGPCPACTEGKMRAPTLSISTSPPASNIGERLHIDFMILHNVSLGGNKYILVSCDEKTSYIAAAGMKDISEASRLHLIP